MKFVNHQIISEFFEELIKGFKNHGKVYLIGESSLVYQRWQRWADKLEFYADIETNDVPDFNNVILSFVDKSGISISDKSPAEIIPLPNGYQDRAIKINLSQINGNAQGKLSFFHFDPYSVSFRFIARGDETDYKLVLNYLHNGWINLDKMERMIENLLPAFSFDTIQQDPAEFRRKYKGLLQMWNTLNVRMQD